MSTAAAQLIIQLEGQVLQTLALTAPVLTIGRTPENDLVLAHPLVARRHAELRIEDGGAALTDLESSSGTFIGETLLLPHQPQLLSDGTIFRVGPFELSYRAAQAADALPAEPAHAEPAVAAVVEQAGEQPRERLAPEPAVAAQLPPITALPADALPLAPVQPLPAHTNGKFPPPRPRLPALPATGAASRYLYDLPVLFHDNDFLGRYLLIFESLWEPLEQRQDQIAMYFDPRTCPASFLPWLASWLQLSAGAGWPEAQLRRLLSEAMELYRWRGTRYGLTRMIELCTGLTPEITDHPTEPFVLRVRLAIPPGSEIEREFVEALIQTHKPAHVGYVLDI